MRRGIFQLIAALAVAAGLLAVFGIPAVGGRSGAAVAAAATPAQQIGMKVLVITDSANSNAAIAYGDWVNTLQREGVPYASVVTNSASPGSVALPALSSTLSNGTQVANYQGVVVALSGPLGLTSAQWTALQTFEHQFSVRQVTAYASPSSDYGLTSPNPAAGGDLTSGSSLTLTGDGQKVFPYLKQVAVDPTQPTYAYQGTPLPGSNVDTLISGPGSSSLLGIYTSADGRQTMYQTFNENQYYLQSELLRHGELEWLTRGAYFGDQRNYVEMDIDDTFTPDDAWNTATHQIDYNDADALRMQPADVAAATTWEAKNNFRMDQLFNMGGTAAYQADNTGSDPLLAAFQATCSSNCGPGNSEAGKPYTDSFGWISHTYDTPYLDVGCATENYIEAELNENTNVAAAAPGATAGTGGLGLTETTNPADALGAEDGHVFVPGNHSGFADLVPGNPATVDPPIFDSDTAAVPSTGTSTLAAGTYEYAITDQFSPTGGQSAADVTAPLPVAAGQSVTLTWQSICHAADYIIYRGVEGTGGTYTWSQIGTVSTPFSATLPDNSSADTTGGSTTNVAGGGETEQTFVDSGVGGTAATEPSTSAENATETAWEQNPYFGPALAAVGITAVGDDGSKPYPNPANDAFGLGASYTGAQYPADGTFVVPGTSAQVVPRHPVNIYYNAATDAQELDEYQTLYGGTSTCGNTTCTWLDVVNQVVSGMFAFMMGNDPRPSYVHQTNIMGTPPAGSEGPNGLPSATYTPPATCTAGAACTKGDGTLYQVLDPLLYEYNQYFNTTAPFEQLTEQAIANLLAEQSAWSSSTSVTGYIEGNQVTVNNSGAGPLETPLTGVKSVGSPYAGSQSGWTDAPAGASTYTAFTTWPAEPTGPVIVTAPRGGAPGGHLASSTNPTKPPTKKISYVAVQTAPRTVSIKRGKVTVSLACVATRGKTPKGKLCVGKLTLKVSRHTARAKFRFKSGKIDRIAVRLPKPVMAGAASLHRRHRKLSATLMIDTTQSKAKALTKRGKLTIRT